MSRNTDTAPATRATHSGAGAICLALGVVAGVALMGWAGQPSTPVAVAAPAPVAQIDYKAITEAVRAGFPTPAPVAVAAPAKPAEAAPARKKRKVHKPAPARIVYHVHGCGCGS